MTKVKCRFCGNRINKDEAIRIKHGKSNWYYCSLEHSTSKSPRDIFYTDIKDIIGDCTNTILFKEFDGIASVHTFEKMTDYLNENKSYLQDLMNKDFKSEYAKIRYLSAIFKNNLGDYHIKEKIYDKKIELEIVEVTPKRRKTRPRRSLLCVFDEYMGDNVDNK